MMKLYLYCFVRFLGIFFVVFEVQAMCRFFKLFYDELQALIVKEISSIETSFSCKSGQRPF